ncbi:MAG: Smr/MutS family protein, partial [Oscillospiraceae bacterium]|nr:Smr/MutS family protein [Oscillospiraceae bacterium]
FSSHMTNIVGILATADKNSLVLMDELGACTDPAEGAALAVAIISQLRRQGAKIAATTHYAEIKMYALQTPGVENASCEFDVSTLRPAYRLLIGTPGRSNAFAISERLGLPAQIIEAAKTGMSSEDTRFEDVVSGLESSRQELELERKTAERHRLEAETLREQAKSIRGELEARFQKEIDQAQQKAQSIVEQTRFMSAMIMDDLEALKREKDRENFGEALTGAKAKLRARMRELESAANPVHRRPNDGYSLPRALKSGDTIYLHDFGTQGTVITPPDEKGYVKVQAGLLKTKVKLENIRLMEDQNMRRVTKDGGAVSTKQARGQAVRPGSAEVDLRGMDSSEAVMEMDNFIDTAVLSNLPLITVIHGKGTGALREAVRNRLKRHRSVKSFRAGAYGEGEAGVTIVELK